MVITLGLPMEVILKVVRYTSNNQPHHMGLEERMILLRTNGVVFEVEINVLEENR